MTQPGIVNDPWAAASATPPPAAPVQPTYPAPTDGQANPLPFNTANLFGNPSELGGGGSFTPTPPMEFLVGRTLVYIPRTFDPAAKNPFATDASNMTRPQWTADMYVIDGGELRFFYDQKADANAIPPRQAATVEQVHENCTPQTPYVVTNSWVSQAAFVPKLTKVSDRRQFLVCTPVRGAQKSQRDAGMTDESVRQAHSAWVARNKQGNEPRFVWLPADVAPDAMASVMAWWEAHKDSIKI
jgi:hypothetical protein